MYENLDAFPLTIRLPETIEEKKLFALAIGLYMTIGQQENTHQTSISTTDPNIHRIFLAFLAEFCGINKTQVSAWVNILSDYNADMATEWWINELCLEPNQFLAPTIQASLDDIHPDKHMYGTLTVSFKSSKLKYIIDQWCNEYYERFSK